MTGQASAGLPSGYPSASVARRALLALALVACVTSSDATMMAVLIEPMKRQMGLSDVQIGLVQGTAFGLAYGIAALPMGRFIDVGRRTRMLVVGILAWGFALAANGLAPNLGVLLVSRAVLGVVSALLIPAAVSLLGDLYPPERRSIATSIFVVGQSCGGGLGILCSGMAFNVLQTMSVRHGWNAELLAPWRVLFYLAAFSAFLLTPLLLLMREPARQERSIERPSLLETLSRLLESREFLIPLLIGLLLGNVSFQASNTWSAPLLMRRFHLTPGDFSGWLSVVTVATGIAGALAGGLAAERARRWAGR
ncbi:MAG: MFS transporter, partial [Gluconobacter cerinus]|uniref:MFS transporter n=1 Tax=Gluconobacter cerinus TaxID=38307 RepID=UPI0039EBD530